MITARPANGREISRWVSFTSAVSSARWVKIQPALTQALLLRRSRDFISVEDYQSWVRATIERDHNHLRAAKLAEEKLYLRPLPEAALPCHTVMLARVRRWSTIRVQGRTSVPARLHR